MIENLEAAYFSNGRVSDTQERADSIGGSNEGGGRGYSMKSGTGDVLENFDFDSFLIDYRGLVSTNSEGVELAFAGDDGHAISEDLADGKLNKRRRRILNC